MLFLEELFSKMPRRKKNQEPFEIPRDSLGERTWKNYHPPKATEYESQQRKRSFDGQSYTRYGFSHVDFCAFPEECPEFDAMAADFFTELQPVGVIEWSLVLQMVASLLQWHRVCRIEAGSFVTGLNSHCNWVKKGPQDLTTALGLYFGLVYREREFRLLDVYRKQVFANYHKALEVFRSVRKQKRDEARQDRADARAEELLELRRREDARKERQEKRRDAEHARAEREEHRVFETWRLDCSLKEIKIQQERAKLPPLPVPDAA